MNIEKNTLKMMEGYIRERMEYILMPSMYAYGYITKDGIYWSLLELEILAQSLGLVTLKDELSEKVREAADKMVKR